MTPYDGGGIYPFDNAKQVVYWRQRNCDRCKKARSRDVYGRHDGHIFDGQFCALESAVLALPMARGLTDAEASKIGHADSYCAEIDPLTPEHAAAVNRWRQSLAEEHVT